MINDPILSAFRALVERHRKRPLVVSPEQSANVADINTLAEAVKTKAISAGIPPGSLVGLAAANGPGFYAGYLGLRRSGYTVLLIDSSTPTAEIDKIAGSLAAAGTLIVHKPWPAAPGDFGFRRAQPTRNCTALPPEVSTVRLSSGSTGLPRGIAHTSGALLNDDAALRKTMGLHDERVLAATPLSHAYGFASVFLPSLTCGWVVIVPCAGRPFGITEAATAGKVTFLPTVPAYLNSLLKMNEPLEFPQSLRLVISAGAPIRPSTALRFREIYRREVRVFYGASEVGGITYDRIGGAGERGTLGSAVDGVTIRLTAQDNAGPGAGVVEVESASAAVGYYPVSEPTLRNGCFTTSDIGRFEGRELVLLGRADNVINIRGKKVTPREIEALLEEIPGVAEAVVVRAVAADGSGEAIHALVAAPDCLLSDTDLLRTCASRMAAHKIPRRIRIVESIPRNSRGKVDFRTVNTILSERVK